MATFVRLETQIHSNRQFAFSTSYAIFAMLPITQPTAPVAAEIHPELSSNSSSEKKSPRFTNHFNDPE